MESEEYKLRRAVALLLRIVGDQPSSSVFWDNVYSKDISDLYELGAEYSGYLEGADTDGE